MKTILALILVGASALAAAQPFPNPVTNSASSPLSRITTPSGQTVTITPQATAAGVRPNNSLGGVTNMPPTVAFFVNYSALMKPVYGRSTIRVYTSTTTDYGVAPQTGGNLYGGDFRTTCATSHMGRFDPLVYPGRNTAGHLHTFFGNSDLVGSLNDQTLGNLASFGRSTCDGGTANRSAYWVPSLVNTPTGVPVAPVQNRAYYKAQSDYRAVTPGGTIVPPPGLRMIAGNPSSTSGQDHIQWYCVGGPGGQSPFLDHIPTAAELSANPSWCQEGAGSTLSMGVAFPQCWDGVNLDSPGHQAHMAYEDFYTGCPSDHPKGIPEISYTVDYSVASLGGRAKIPAHRLSSDNYPTTSPGGYSAHGDWINGWQPQIIEAFVNNCLLTGTDCHTSVIDKHGTSPFRILCGMNDQSCAP